MRPRVKVAKGWNYRLILVDKDGVCAWDDYKHLDQVRVGHHLLFEDYEKELIRRRIVVEI